MVTFHIPQIAPSSGGWVVLLFSNKTGAHAELFCCVVSVSFSLSFLFFFVCWRMDKAGDQTTANWSGHRWRCVSRLWVVQASECHVSLSPPEVWLSKQCICTRESSLFSFSLDTFLLLKSQTRFVTQNINALIWKPLCKASIRKRKCYLLLCHILSFVLIFPFDPVTCYFLS